MDRLHGRRDPGPGEAWPVVGMEQLDVLEAGHQRQRPGRRLERVERGPDTAVADRVDDRRDAVAVARGLRARSAVPAA